MIQPEIAVSHLLPCMFNELIERFQGFIVLDYSHIYPSLKSFD